MLLEQLALPAAADGLMTARASSMLIAEEVHRRERIALFIRSTFGRVLLRHFR